MSSFYTNKKVLVTGGAGFIGSHIVEQLLEAGAQVTVLDNFSTGKKENLPTDTNLSIITGDICNPTTCNTALDNQEIVFHLAAFTRVPQSFDNPQECFEINSVGTHNLLKAARKNGVERFIFSSSCAVYGTQTDPCTETMTCAPTSPYGYSKLMGEILCKQYADCFGLATFSLRYFNVFGPRQNPHDSYAGVVTAFINKMKANQPVTIFGTGEQTRDFIPVQEVAKTNLHIGALQKDLLSGGAVNVATGSSTTINRLFEQLKKEYNYPHEAHKAPERPGDIVTSQADCTYLRKLTSQTTL